MCGIPADLYSLGGGGGGRLAVMDGPPSYVLVIMPCSMALSGPDPLSTGPSIGPPLAQGWITLSSGSGSGHKVVKSRTKSPGFRQDPRGIRLLCHARYTISHMALYTRTQHYTSPPSTGQYTFFIIFLNVSLLINFNPGDISWTKWHFWP